jgi:hypothetical protein
LNRSTLFSKAFISIAFPWCKFDGFGKTILPAHEKQCFNFYQILPTDFAEEPHCRTTMAHVSSPLATILLALIAVTFIRISAHQDKTDLSYIIAAVVFATYYNLSGLAKTLVEQGVVGSVPGVWWLDLLMLIFLVIYAMLSRDQQFLRQK